MSDQLVFFYTTLQMFPMIRALPYLFFGTPSSPPSKLLRMQWSREEGFRRTERFQAAVSECREVVCIFQDAAELVHQCLLRGKQMDFS